MNKKRFGRAVALLTILIPAIAVAADSVTLKSIMQELRDDLVDISDGLLTDDFELVANGAAGIANHPQIPAAQVQLVAAELGTEMAAFKQLDTLVHDLAIEISAAAKVGDGDAAISDYQRMIEGCFACHRTYKERVAAVLNQEQDPSGQR